MLEHSCAPNASVGVRCNGSGATLEVVARRPIEAGEAISFSYLDEAWLAAAAVRQRRERLKRELGFWCLCARCERETAALGG